MTGQRSIGLGPNWALVGSGWAGPTRTRGTLRRCHVTTMGLYWALSTACLTPCGSRWTSAHGPWTYGRAHGGPSPPSLLPGSAHVHRAHARVVGEGVFPCFRSRRCSRRRRAPGEPPWQCWCPIGEGKGFPGSRRLRLWGQGGGQSFPRCWPQRSVAQAPPACGKARVLRHRPLLWCAWATQCSSEHVGQVEGSSRASGGLGHGGGLPSTTVASVWGLRPR